ncbi:unnamed protein product, partial [Prorocentrum cordatum]
IQKKTMNADYNANIQELVKTITDHPAFANIQSLDPLPINREVPDGGGVGFQVAFDQALCDAAMATAKQYQCGANIFWADCLNVAAKGVPCRHRTTEALAEFLYPDGEAPGYYEGIIIVNVSGGKVDKKDLGTYGLISPEEAVHAAYWACARDIRAGKSDDVLAAWKTLFLTVTMKFTAYDDDLIFFKAKTLRNTIVQEHDSLARTAFQEVCEIANLKAQLEQSNGREISAGELVELYNTKSKLADSQEEITFSFVDSALTVWSRALSIPSVLHAVRQLDESHSHRSLFDSITKLQTIISKAKTEENIEYVFLALADAFIHKMIVTLPLRELQGYGAGQMGKGVIDEVLFKRDVKQWMRQEWLTRLKAITNAEKDIIRDVTRDFATLREKCGCRSMDNSHVDITWQAELGKPALAALELFEDRRRRRRQ